MADQPARRKFRLQFSLRTLLLTVLFGGSAALLWMHWEPWRYELCYCYKFLYYERPELTEDGSKLLMHRDENTISIVDIASGVERSIVGDDYVPVGNDRLVIFKHDNTLSVVNAGTGIESFSIKNLNPLIGEQYSSPNVRRWMLTISKDLKLMAIPDAAGVKLYSLDSGEFLSTMAGFRPICFSNDAKLLVTANEATVYVQNVADGEVRLQLNRPSAFHFSRISPDLTKMAIMDQHAIRVIDFAECKACEFPDIEGVVNWVSFSPDSKYVAVKNRSSELFIWNTTTAAMRYARAAGDFREFLPDGNYYIQEPWGGAGEIVDPINGRRHTIDSMLPLEKGESVFPEYMYPEYRVFSHKDNDIFLWDFQNRTRIGVLKNIKGSHYRGPMISPSGRHVVTTDGRNSWIWSLETGAVQTLGLPRNHETKDAREAGDVAWTPDEKCVIRSWIDLDTVRLYKLRRPESRFGFLYLPEFWLTLAFAIALGWSLRRGRKIQ